MSRAGEIALRAAEILHARQREAYPDPKRPPPIVLLQRVKVDGRTEDRRADLDDPAVQSLVAEANALGMGVTMPENGFR